MERDEARLVESGAFRVDSRRALEVLRERQIADSFWRPALWVRCAAACRARRMSFVKTAGTLTVTFDGSPLPSAVLAAPFGRLLGEDGAPAERWFGWALLHTLRPGVEVAVSSGPASYVYAEDGAPRRTGEGGPGTLVTARWRFLSRTDPTHPRNWRLLESYGEDSYRLIPQAAGAPFPILFREWGGAELEQKPWPGREPVDLSAQEPRLKLYLLGTLVYDGALPGFPFPVAVSLGDDGLAVDASLASVVRDQAFEGAAERARSAAEAAVRRALAWHARSFPLAARLLAARERLRLDWVRTMGLTRGDEPFLDSLKNTFSDARRSGDRQRVLRAAESTRRLRAWAVAGLRARRVDAHDPLRDALWRAPLFFTTRGAPASLDDLDADSGRLPEVWRGLAPPPADRAEALWALSPMDTVFLRKRFPGRPARA